MQAVRFGFAQEFASVLRKSNAGVPGISFPLFRCRARRDAVPAADVARVEGTMSDDPVDLKELRLLRDRQEILDCINAYARGLDRLDAELIRRTFHPDAIDNHGPFVGGVDEFVPFAIEIESSFIRTHHGVTTHTCEIDGDLAHAESYVHFFVRLSDGRNLGAGGARYVDQLARRDGRWAITIRRIFMDWSFVVPCSSWLGPQWDLICGTRDRRDPSYERPLSPPRTNGEPA
jgi:ketosteroid isomerase-like protein